MKTPAEEFIYFCNQNFATPLYVGKFTVHLQLFSFIQFQ